MKYIRWLLLVGLLCFSDLLLAQPLQAVPACKRTFIVGALSESPYYSFTKDSAKITGLVRDFLDEIQRRTGCQMFGQPMNHVRAYDDIKNSRLDIFALLASSEKWNAAANFVQIYSFQRVLLVRGASFVEGKTVQQYIDDPKIKFANLIGTESSFTKEELSRLQKQERIIQSSSPDGLVKLVTSGKAQVVFLTPAYLSFLRKKGVTKKDIEAVFDENVNSDVGLYLSKKRISKKEIAQLKSTIESMRSEGTIMKILAKYVSSDHLKRYK